jgi:hypothetical protein
VSESSQPQVENYAVNDKDLTNSTHHEDNSPVQGMASNNPIVASGNSNGQT